VIGPHARCSPFLVSKSLLLSFDSDSDTDPDPDYNPYRNRDAPTLFAFFLFTTKGTKRTKASVPGQALLMGRFEVARPKFPMVLNGEPASFVSFVRLW
jgi:hypothetical protein